MASGYSITHLRKYLKYMGLPMDYAQAIHDPTSFPKTEEALTSLFKCQIKRFPYDNLSVHYSATHIVDIDPATIYAKLMGAVYMTGVRNRARIDGIPQGDFKGWTHTVNIVQLPSGTQYHVDAAFGGDGPTSPLQLTSGRAVPNLGTQEVRLTYKYRNGPEKDWNAFYCFSELEVFQDDFEVLNTFTSWEAYEKGNMWVVKFLQGGEMEGLAIEDGELGNETQGAVSVVGMLMFVNDVVKLNLGGKTRVITSFCSESERLRCLKKWFSSSI
ncbi:arylamine N-acetyltransferase 2 [Aspergillus germanicus]